MSAIDEVKQKLDIAEVIGQYATLKKAGRNLTALCPFHSEKHPSFFVYPEQQSWHCFGACNTGGDIFAFVMKKEGLDFGEALRLLARRAGVTLPSKFEVAPRQEEKEPFFSANEAAALYYHNLLINSPAAAKAKNYLEKRGFTAKTISDFQIGYAPDSWDALKLYLLERNYDEKTLITAGLLYEDEKGKTSDRFRGKLMIPIRDIKGRVTGFGARVLDNSEPKYKNSPQSPTFDKSGTLYGIDKAAAAIRKRDCAIIMEGYMDVIMAHQCGVANAVASMGTAITETQVNILKKLTKNLVLSLDADAAGEEAMLRTVGYENILNAEMRVILLPEGKDPDEVMQEGMDKWQSLVNAAVPLVDFLFEKTIVKLDLTTARDKSAAVDRLLPVIAAINDPIRQAHYLQKLAALVKVDMNTIKASLSRLKPSPVRRLSLTPKPATGGTLRPLSSSSREEYCLALLLQYPELREYRQDILLEYFKNSENREILNIIKGMEDIALIKERLDPALHEHLDAIINMSIPSTKINVEKKYVDIINELKKRFLKSVEAMKANALTSIDNNEFEDNIEIVQQLNKTEIQSSQKWGSTYTKGTRR